MEKRGKIINRKRKKQLSDFSGLRYGKITPTDIDGFIDFGNIVFIFFELKLEDVELPTGQRLALERLVDGMEKEGKCSIGIIAIHGIFSTNKDIDASSCIVTCYRFKKQWVIPKKEYTLKQMIDSVLRKFSPRYLKK